MTADPRYWQALDGSGADPAVVGGKGAWLDRLAAHGFPVPPAVALTTHSYRAVTADPQLADLLELTRRSPVPTGERRAEAMERVDAAFLAVTLPESVHAAIAAAAQHCRAADSAALAARSSATAEDMETTSFAGQYLSLLDLADDAALQRAVRLIWASLWHPAPCAYRRFHGLDESRLAMAVVLMPMVPAETAGVAFTVDPAGSPDRIRVESVSGLGEQLVSGRVTPRVDLVPRIGTHIGDSAGIDAAIAEVARLALSVEAAFGQPQDIEWARTRGRTLLLQARPITAAARVPMSDGFDTHTEPATRWTTAGIAEMLPGVLPPLLWDTAGTLTEEAFRALFDQLRALPPMDPRARIIGRFRMRAALNLALLEQVAAQLPGGSPQEVEEQYFGKSAGERPATEQGTGGFLAGLRHDVDILRLNRRANREAETVVVAAEVAVREPVDLALPDAVLLQRRRRLLDLAGRTALAEAAVAAAGIAAYRQLESWLGRRLGPKTAQRWTQRLVRPAAGGVRWAQLLPDDPALAAILDHERTWIGAEPLLLQSEAGRGWRGAFLDTARRAGSAAVFAGPTWDEDRESVWRALRAARDLSRSGTGTGQGQSAGQERLNADWRQLLEDLRHSPRWSREGSSPAEIYDVRLLTLRGLIGDSIDLLDRRERTKSALLALGGQVRRIHLELGRRLSRRGLLAGPADVQLLSEAELLQAVTDATAPSLAELAQRDRWLQRCSAEGALPPVFSGRPPQPQAAVSDGASTLHGWAASSGTLTGRPVVVSGPDRDIDRGDILIAHSTDASWSPLFLRAGAIALEQGGPLSHAAIVARELGIPAVLNVPVKIAPAEGAAEATVDGDNGVVTLA